MKVLIADDASEVRFLHSELVAAFEAVLKAFETISQQWRDDAEEGSTS